jgi:hypothetical protein
MSDKKVKMWKVTKNNDTRYQIFDSEGDAASEIFDECIDNALFDRIGEGKETSIIRITDTSGEEHTFTIQPHLMDQEELDESDTWPEWDGWFQ